jgi:hypothetical protein
MQTSPTMREKQLNIRLSEEEAERLEIVTKHHGLNGANLFRMLLKREADTIKRENPGDPFGRVPGEPQEVVVRAGDKVFRSTVTTKVDPRGTRTFPVKFVDTKKASPKKGKR